MDKLAEEARELAEVMAQGAQPGRLADELGDLLFVMANLARHLDVDPEAAIRKTNAKFERRFRKIEDWLAETGRTPAESDLAEMDALWNEAKRNEHSPSSRPSDLSAVAQGAKAEARAGTHTAESID